ncbi:MAG: NHLP bacteriocin export ABC transporter permease/ATPase subunit [Coriobacteriia bacterium]|nr:NHLP bacteriocin export ABC transporter permease/ATPase subunit [Coriobacteriia bacterium]
MGWFDSQIQERLKSDREGVESSIADLTEALTGFSGAHDASRATTDAVADVLAYFGARPQEAPQGTTALADVIDAQVRPLGIMYREVSLTPGWSREAAGVILGTRDDGTPVALLPHGARGYACHDHATGKVVPLGSDDTAGLRRHALLFYRPLPAHELGVRDILAFLARSVDRRDWIMVAVAALAVSLIGLVLPALNQVIFGPLVASGNASLVAPVAVVLLCVTFAQIVIGVVKSLLISRIQTRVSVALSAAVMMRVLQLPTGFFKKYSAGALATRIACVQAISDTLQSVILGAGLTATFSVVYIFQILTISPALVGPALVATLATVGVLVAIALAQARMMGELLEWRSKRSGWEYALIGGMQKIRLAGAESRAYSRWADIYKNEVRLTYRGPVLVRYGAALQVAVSLAGTLWIYWTAVSQGVSVADYMAFTTAYGMVSGALMSLGAAAAQGMAIRPYLDMARPLLEEVPELSERRHAVGRVTGGIEMDHVTFSYGEGRPPILKDLSFKIRPGQYVGVVGRTGCGKSTLLRLLLGFEEPQTGAVYYDGRDLSTLDLRGLRRNIGVVLQDGKLFAGDIYSNIVVSAPWLTLDDAWAAAELAGIADDIRAMPMGMQTIISEGAGGLSGGQRQRLMIARAIAAKPKILMFDEATSALDNVCQRIVSESLASLRCTRIAIAHRLSTIRECDRILVLDGGRIAEDGTYDELMAQGGIFSELVARQQV